MDDQFFSSTQSAQPFDVNPMGFSPSIDTLNNLPLTLEETLENPAFMHEVQRKRADTITMLKPATFDHTDHAMTQRPRALHRLSLTPSVESSIASTTTSEFDYSGCDSEADSVAPSPAFDDHSCSWSTSHQAMPDLASTRFNMATAHMMCSRFDYHSPTTSSAGLDLPEQNFSTDFSFTEFIQDGGAQSLENDQDDDEDDALAARMSTLRPGMASVMGYSVLVPTSPFADAHTHPGACHAGLGIFGAFDNSDMSPLGMTHSTGQAMVMSQSVPSCHAMGIYEPCSPSSTTSARSSSPYPTSSFAPGALPSVLQSPSLSRPVETQHRSSQSAGSRVLPKGVSLFNHFAHLANPYAGLITKRSRGRRVPNKPEEMNNLGKSGKVYTCKVPGCGKCFKRSEHLKRHVRSIHTDDKPFLCHYPACNKRFSRHDNLNQHARVHTTSSSDLMQLNEGFPLHCMRPLSHLDVSMHPSVKIEQQ